MGDKTQAVGPIVTIPDNTFFYTGPFGTVLRIGEIAIQPRHSGHVVIHCTSFNGVYYCWESDVEKLRLYTSRLN